MSIWKKKLSLLLLFQILLAGGLWAWTYNERAQSTTTQELLAFDTSEVTKVELLEQDRSLILSLEEGDWVLPDHHSLPAEGERVQKLLNSLRELQSNSPETTSSSAHQRLGLSEDKPEGRVKLYAGEKLVGDLLLGSIPSFGQRYVRLGDQNEAYRIRWQTINTQASSRAWLDSALLAVESPQRIELPKLTLQLQEGKWFSGQDELDPAKANALIDKIRKLSVIDVANEVEPSSPIEVRVEGAQGEAYTYSFFEKDGKHYVMRDDLGQAFQTSSEISKALLEADLSRLKEQPKTEKSS